METLQKEILRGGQFLVKESKCEDVFTPEDFSEEQIMMKDAVKEFNDREIIAHRERFEAKDYKLTEEVMKKAGEFGFLGVAVPEAYGGLEMGPHLRCKIVERITTSSGSVGSMVMVPNSLGPAELIHKYGTSQQKEKYLQKLATSEYIPCFGLTGLYNGSDAVNMQCSGYVVKIDGKARGIIARDLITGEIERHSAHAVVIATGGYGNVYFLSTNAMGSNATAAWKIHKKGAYFANPCFTQIHPTCIPRSGDYQSKLTLMSESLRNDGRIWVPAKIEDAKAIQQGKLKPTAIAEEDRDYYLERRYPAYGNLVPRDVASRAAKERCDSGYGVNATGEAVYLDFKSAINRYGIEQAKIHNIDKLHKHSHLYTSNDKIVFPGRRFKVDKVFPYSKKIMIKHFSKTKANITTRNFPETVAQIRTKHKISDGGTIFAFFTTNLNNEKIVLLCEKIENNE